MDDLDTITITGGSGTDSLTVSDTVMVIPGSPEPALTTQGITSISLDDLITTSSITLPTSGAGYMGSYSINNGVTGYNITSGAGTGYTWTNSFAPTVTIDTDGVNVKEGGDIKIAGKSLSEAIEKIEERLGILKPNPELEERWDKLKELRKQYMELEKDLLEKEKIMKILKEA